MHAYEIDNNGYIIINYDVINGDVEIPDGCITVQLPQPLLFYKPKWTGTEWVEGATKEEIDEITKPVPQPSTEMDLLKEELTLLKSEKDALAETLDMLLTEIIPNLTGGI